MEEFCIGEEGGSWPEEFHSLSISHIFITDPFSLKPAAFCHLHNRTYHNSMIYLFFL